MKQLIAAVFLLSVSLSCFAQKDVTSPEEAFGFKLGSDRKLGDWTQLTAYYKTLNNRATDLQHTKLQIDAEKEGE